MDGQALLQWAEQYLMATYARAPVVLVKGQGARVWDMEGKEYLDFLGGVGVNGPGHCHPRVVEAIRRQAGELLHCSNLYHIEPQIRLARELAGLSGLQKAFFCNSGAEAVEAALKLARKYSRLTHGPDRYEIITTHNSFHGRTYGALAATGQTRYHQGYEPMPPGFRFVPFNNLAALREAVSGQTCAVILEAVQGEGGIFVAGEDYLRGARRLCDERGILLILDEVQCGIGRTGKMFAYQHYGVRPDLVALSKSLGGGVAIGALLAGEHVAAAWGPGDHGSTFGGNPLAAAAALATLEVLREEGLVDRAAELGRYFQDRLSDLCRRVPGLVEVRGLGLMLGLELAYEGREVVEACRQRGLLINCTHRTVLRFLPPLVITREELDRGLEILEEVLMEKVSTGAAGPGA